MPKVLQAMVVNLDPSIVSELRARAKTDGYTLHRWLQRHFAVLTGRRFVEPNIHELSSDANTEELTETVVVEISHALARRLHATARQMRAPSGQPVPPSWLGRQIVQHLCYQKTDIAERLRTEVDPAYVDMVPFMGKIKERAGREWHALQMKCTMAARDAIIQAARQRDTTVTALVRKILDAALPKYE